LDDDDIPPGFAPFNVQGIGNNIYVTYAAQDSAKHDPVGGAGLGFVAVFNHHGRKIAHLEHGDWFNAPWESCCPADFGVFSHAISGWQFSWEVTLRRSIPLTGRYLGVF